MAPARDGMRTRTRGRSAQRVQDRRPGGLQGLPFTRLNVAVFAAGIGVILLGYLCLAQPPVDGFLSLTLAPILLVLGYCVLIPISLLLRESPAGDAASEDGSRGGCGRLAQLVRAPALQASHF